MFIVFFSTFQISGKILEKHKLPELTQRKVENMNGLLYILKFEFVI